MATEGRAYWVEPSVVRDDNVWERFATREHPLQDHAETADYISLGDVHFGRVHSQRIVDLLELWVHRRIKSSVLEHFGHFRSELEVRVQVKGLVQCRVDPVTECVRIV